MAEQVTEFSVDTASVLAEEEHGAAIVGRSPWYLAWRRLRRNYIAFAFLALFFMIIAACALAPVYADRVAETGPNTNHATDEILVDGESREVLSEGGTYLDPKTGLIRVKTSVPIGPTWASAGGKFVLGADENGRDVAVRLLYGGINTLKVGIGAAIVCVILALLLALLAGYYGGWVDWVITRTFDVIWAFPVILLAIALGTALAVGGFHWIIDIEQGSLWIPTFVIGLVYVPYVARPLRGQILSLREKEFVEAAIGQGAGAARVMFREMLPNIASSAIVFFTLIIANAILTEAALSFLGAGVQPPNPSWGTLIAEGQARIVTAPWLTLVPGIAIVLTVLSLNVFGDGLRDALDPRAKIRIEH